jgi:pyruvate/2-oxoglutarate/acetoin dehydrogenase E1 component
VSQESRIGECLGKALHSLFGARPRLLMLGEDIADPYGGAFGISRGLSTRFPDRVISTPISENAITGMAGGLALMGDEVIVEVMFGDFITLAFDPIVNFISKSVTMYGRPLRMPVIIRCPSGGNRGYGPTHSQNLHKHFTGIPNLSLYELSPMHPVLPVLERILDHGRPAIFFEDKVLYTQRPCGRNEDDGLFEFSPLGGESGWAHARLADEPPDWLLVAPGGLVRRALAAMRRAMLEREIASSLLTPSQLFPLDFGPVLPSLTAAKRILVLDDGPAGGGWPVLAADSIHRLLWNSLEAPVGVLQPGCAVVPAARHLEQRVLLQESTIYAAITSGGTSG